MNPKRIVAGILLIIVVTMIVYPPLSTGTVSIKFTGRGVGSADHLYVTIGLIELHGAGLDNQTGWNQFLNRTVTLDLMDQVSLAERVMKGTLHTGRFDMISVGISSASLVIGTNQTTLVLSSEQYIANISLVLKTLSESTVTVQFNFDVTEMTRTGTFNLVLEATAALL